MPKELHYKRSRLVEGILLLFMIEMTALAFIVVTGFLMAEEGQEFVDWVHLAIVAVATVIALIFSVPHLKNGKQVFEYHCDSVWVSCHSPGAYPLDYRVSMQDIKLIKRYILKQRGRELFYIVDNNDEEYHIPVRFGFNSRRAVKAIQGFRPNIEVVKHFS